MFEEKTPKAKQRVCGNNSFWDRARLLPMFGCCHWRHAAWCLDVEKTFYWSWNIEEMRDREQYHLFLFSFFTLFFTKKINWNVKKKCNSISARFMAAYSFFHFPLGQKKCFSENSYLITIIFAVRDFFGQIVCGGKILSRFFIRPFTS